MSDGILPISCFSADSELSISCLFFVSLRPILFKSSSGQSSRKSVSSVSFLFCDGLTLSRCYKLMPMSLSTTSLSYAISDLLRRMELFIPLLCLFLPRFRFRRLPPLFCSAVLAGWSVVPSPVAVKPSGWLKLDMLIGPSN